MIANEYSDAQCFASLAEFQCILVNPYSSPENYALFMPSSIQQ